MCIESYQAKIAISKLHELYDDDDDNNNSDK